jgi:hypothetical protein
MYYECNLCKEIYENIKYPNNPCLCGGSIKEVIELTGRALEGDNIFKIDETLAMSLNSFVNKDIVITMKER